MSGKKKLSKHNVSLINSHAASFNDAVSCYIRDNNGTELSGWISGVPDEYSRSGKAVKQIFSEAVLDSELVLHNRLRLLIINWCAHELRMWALNLK